MTNHIAVKKTLKQLEKRNRRAKKNRRSAVRTAAVPIRAGKRERHEDSATAVAEQMGLIDPKETSVAAVTRNWHLTAMQLCKCCEKMSAEETTVNLASSMFPWPSAEQPSEVEEEPVQGPKDRPLSTELVGSHDPIWQRLVTNKAKSSEVLRARPVPAKRYSVSAESTILPPTSTDSLGVLAQLSLAIQRNKFILDLILRNKDVLAKRDDISESELCTFVSSAESSEEVNSRLRGLFSETDECNSRLRGLFSDISSQSARSSTSFDPRWLYKSTKAATSTDATDLGSEFSLPSVPSDSLRNSSFASIAHVGTQTSEWRRLFCSYVSAENIGNQKMRMSAVEAESVPAFIQKISDATSLSDYIKDLESVVDDYLDLCKKIYFPA